MWYSDYGTNFISRITDAADPFTVSLQLCNLGIDLSAQKLCISEGNFRNNLLPVATILSLDRSGRGLNSHFA